MSRWVSGTGSLINRREFPGPTTSGFFVSQITVGTSAVLVLAANNNRGGILHTGHPSNSGSIFIGFTSGVTTSTGFQLTANRFLSFAAYLGDMWAIASAAGQTLMQVFSTIT